MPTSFAFKQSLLVGREMEKSHILQIITNDDQMRQIIPIWGMGGLGKTALARSIYENQDICGMFQNHAWMNSSHPSNAAEFFRSLILQLTEDGITLQEPLQNMQLKDLIEESNKLLRTRRYLIVLDNVSSFAEWKFLIEHIIEEENGSRIIVTTREKSVAEHCSIDNIYKLEALKDNAAFELFIKKVRMETANFDQRHELVEQAKRILYKCNGLPLAIDTIGGLLATKPKTAPEWEKFNEHFSSEFENNPSLEMIRTVLTSNCEDLPYHLKLCFLYLSMFPERIRRRRLVRRWIAEGYSNGSHNMTAEENGEGYFADLISRSIIQPSVVAGSGASTNYCHVHSLLHETSVSKSVEEKFSFVLHSRSNLHTKDTIRHLSIKGSWKRVKDELKSIGDLSTVRSLTVCGEWQSFLISEEMRMIRVLDLEGTSGLRDHHIEHMTKLLHLKYLSLRGCDGLFCLPDSLGNLWDLQTLDIRGTSIIVLPATTAKLRKLQYLRAGRIPEDEQLRDPMDDKNEKEDEMPEAVNTTIKWTAATVGLVAAMVQPQLAADDVNRKDAFNIFCRNVFPCLAWGLDMHGVEIPKGIGKINSLHTLGVVNFAAGKAISTKLGNASQLRKLGVTGIKRDNSERFFAAISNLILLQSLSIRSEGVPGLQDCLDGNPSSVPRNIRSLKLYGNLLRLPTWVSQLQNLAKLKLRSTRLWQGSIEVMGMLKHLAILRLLQHSVEGEDLQFHFKCGSFPALVLLQLDGLPDLRSVEFEKDAASRLELLQVERCTNMDKGGCAGLSSLQSLKEVSLKAGHGYDDKFTQELRMQLASNPNRPILKEN
ncbi:hypothetical protein BS78_04G083500 [Paspalum vaginatum]|nr:hypothetical protein BS78_04G083500 [Paspalum vaginatum]